MANWNDWWPRLKWFLVFLAITVLAWSGNAWARRVAWEDGIAKLRADPCDGSSALAPAVTLTTADMWRFRRLTADPLALRLTGGDLLENEVHDCQRLVVGGAYANLVGVFPLDEAMDQAGADGFDDGRVVASVFNYGDTDVVIAGSLTIPAGLSCLWLRWDGSTWTGALAQPGEYEWCIEDPEPPETFALAVNPLGCTGCTVADYPPTARFGWDSIAAAHYVGSKCADQWCEIGVSGFTGTTAIATKNDVPGWSDVQHLAVRDSLTGQLTPGPWGTIRPLAHGAFGSGSAVAVAEIEIVTPAFAANAPPDDNPAYYGFFKYVAVFSMVLSYTTLDATNVMGTAQGWVNLDPLSGTGFFGAPSATTGGGALVTVSKDELHASVGAVRWRWRETDETVWVECDGGCCHLE